MIFDWDDSKNEWLIKNRKVSFQQVEECFLNGNFHGVFKNPSENYPNQEVFLVTINGYPHIVPFVDDDKTVFLKTIIPDRRFKKFIEKDK